MNTRVIAVRQWEAFQGRWLLVAAEIRLEFIVWGKGGRMAMVICRERG